MQSVNAHHPRHHYRLAAALRTAGYDVRTLAPPDLTPGQPDAAPVEYLPVRRSRLGRMLSGPLSIMAAARRRPAAIHVMSLELLPWAALLAMTGRCRVLYDSNEEYDSMMLIKEWIPGRARPLVGRCIRWAEPWLAARLDAATTALPATQAKFEAAGVDSTLVRNFPPASLTEHCERKQPTWDVLVGGTLLEDQIPLLARTAAELNRIGMGDAQWLVAARNYGAREQELLESALVHTCVRERFDLRYNVPFVEMKDLMSRSRVGFVLYPGDANYGARIPIRIFEYMASGLPFVASDLPTTSEFTRDHDVAELVQAGDTTGYAEAIAGLLHDSERRNRMSRNGPLVARAHYNWETESRRLIEVYERLLGRPFEA